jgi:hypothetical protein
MQRYESFNIIQNGYYSAFSKFAISSAFIIMLICIVKVAISIDERVNGQLNWARVFPLVIYLLFFPIGIWLVWPKIRNIDLINL